MAETIDLTVQGFNSDELAEFLNEKKVKWQCESCGTHAWLLLSEERFPVHAIHAVGPDGNAMAGHLRTVAMQCTNCSLVRLYGWMPFNDWLKQKRNKKS